MTKNPTSQTDMLEKGVDDFMRTVTNAAARSLEANISAIEAMSEIAIMNQRMATQRLVLESVLRQRAAILKLAEKADSGMTQLFDAQLGAFDKQIVASLESCGVPQEATEAALLTYRPARVTGKTTTTRIA